MKYLATETITSLQASIPKTGETQQVEQLKHET